MWRIFFTFLFWILFLIRQVIPISQFTPILNTAPMPLSILPRKLTVGLHEGRLKHIKKIVPSSRIFVPLLEKFDCYYIYGCFTTLRPIQNTKRSVSKISCVSQCRHLRTIIETKFV